MATAPACAGWSQSGAHLASLADGAGHAELRTGITAARAALDEQDPVPGRVAERLGTAVLAHRSVPAALWCAARGGSVLDTIALALDLGGDTDTIGAMAAAVAAAAHGAEDVPTAVWQRCEPEMLAALDEAAQGLG